MRVVFAECQPHYETYLAPYQVWGFLEEGESPATAFSLGMLPSNREMTRFYLTRGVRIRLDRYVETGAVRRVTRKCSHLRHQLVPRAAVELDASMVEMCLRYMNESKAWATRRTNSLDAGSLFARLDGPTATHVLTVHDATVGLPVGLVLLYCEPPIAYYAMAWLDEAYRTVYVGKYMKILAIQEAVDAGLTHLYLGTCYSEAALYKTEFPGMEYFDGVAWSTDRHRLRLLLREQDRMQHRHLYEHPAYLEKHPAPGPSDATLRLVSR